MVKVMKFALYVMSGEITPKTHPEIIFEEFRLFWSEWTMKVSGHFQ